VQAQTREVGQTNEAGLVLIRTWEGFRAKPYLCPAGVWTIGYGTTRLPDGKPVTADTPAIDEVTATAWLAAHLKETEAAIMRLVEVPISANQFSALASFVYNVGVGAFAGSTLLKKLNRGDYERAAREFGRWRYARGNVVLGLVRRRAAERALFEKAEAATA
jgi:GH24 family phage-related lysozyme (muramidase)